MIEKLVQNVEELNAEAMHLLQCGDLDALRVLAKARAVPYAQTQAYIQGKRYRLADVPVAEKTFRCASEKLREEMLALSDPGFATIIGWHITHMSREDETLEQQVLKKHKSLQHCLDFINEKAFELATKQAKEQGQDHVAANTGLALTEREVFPWAEEYYRNEDQAVAEKKAAEEKNKILSEWGTKEKSATKAAALKGKPSRKEKADPPKAEKIPDDAKRKPVKAAKKSKDFSQMSLFDQENR